jgi:outer membrane protein OmpA-like peptidoglycan-associated protein
MGASVGYQSSKAPVETGGHEGASRGLARTPPQSMASSALALSAGWAPLGVQRACGCGGAGVEDESIGRSAMQPSLTVSTPDDPFEIEADRVADQVMRMPASAAEMPRISRLQISRLADSSALHRSCAGCAAEDGDLSSVVAGGLSGGGQTLDDRARAFMESRFGHDFSHVRVHTASRAAESARALDARAYTVGSDIAFAAGQYATETNSGRRLIAHELVHAIQQGAAPGAVARAPAVPADCGDPAIPDINLNCKGTERDGPGEVVGTSTGWELRNFDVDKHFLKPGHQEELVDTIVPVLKTFLAANPGKQVKLLGEASTTAGDCYNMRLSRRRARCVAGALEDLGIPAAVLDIDWIGDRESEVRLAAKPVKIERDIENPDDRRVRITIAAPEPECGLDAKLRASTVLDFRFGCLSRNTFSVVIANQTESPAIFREFTWEKIFAVPEDCEFFPDLDPTDTFTRTLEPVRLAWTDAEDVPSDFAPLALQKTMGLGPFDPYDALEFESKDESTLVSFSGKWNPASCENGLRIGEQIFTIGRLKPAGPVQCGPMPVPKSVKCETPKHEDCPADRRESTASRFKAKTEGLSFLAQKAVDLLPVDTDEVRHVSIGTIKTDEEKRKGGDDIWRAFIFGGKRVLGPEGCEERDSQDSARGEAKSDDPESLDGVHLRVATLTRKANSNVESLWIQGLGTFELFGETCSSGGTESFLGTVVMSGRVHCEPLEMDAVPAEKSCTDACPKARRTCAHNGFLFKFGRMAPDSAPSKVQEWLHNIGCQAEVARVNIGAVSTHPIWRPFLWIQPTSPCPFVVNATTLAGFGGKLTVGVKPKLKFGWPPVGIDPVDDTGGLRLATKNPDDPEAPSEFDLPTSLTSMALMGSGSSTSFGLSGLTWTHYDMATKGAPVNWTGSCRSSDGGLLMPLGAVECGLPPTPAHDPAAASNCPADILTLLENFNFLVANFGMLRLLRNHPGIITQLTSKGTPLYSRGQVVRAARFVGLTFGAGKTVDPVVTIFDMLVDDVVRLPGSIEVKFTVLSEPCTYRWGFERVPFRLDSASCEESIKQGGNYTISNDLPVASDDNQMRTA